MTELFAELPSGWDTIPLRYIGRSTSGGTPSRDNGDYWGGDIPWVSSKDMKSEEITDTEEYITEEGLASGSATLVPENSILMVVRSGILKHTIPIAVTTKPVAINQDIKAIVPTRNNILPRFVAEVVRGYEDALLSKWRVQGATVESLDSDEIDGTEIPFPPLEVQKEIVGFCKDRATEIDKALDIQRNLVETLHERKSSIIEGATTTGIQDTETKDSDVDWIGEVPEHWDVVRTRYVADLESGHTPSKSEDKYWEDCDIPWVTTSDIEDFRDGRKVYLHDTEYKINELGLEDSGARMLPEGTVFLSRTASVGFSGIMAKDMATSQDFANWVPSDEIISEYLLYVFRSMNQEFERLMQGSTHQTIYMPDIKSFKTPLPPKDEQREIVEHIEEETEKIWELIDKVEESIDLLEEKRQALITAAVTGQIDVSEELNEEEGQIV